MGLAERGMAEFPPRLRCVLRTCSGSAHALLTPLSAPTREVDMVGICGFCCTLLLLKGPFRNLRTPEIVSLDPKLKPTNRKASNWIKRARVPTTGFAETVGRI